MRFIKHLAFAVFISTITVLVWYLMDLIFVDYEWHAGVASYFDVWFFGTVTAYIAKTFAI